MAERVQNQSLRSRKYRVSLLTHILKVLKDDPDMRQIALQKLLENEDISGDSSLVQLATESRIRDLRESQDRYDL